MEELAKNLKVDIPPYSFEADHTQKICPDEAFVDWTIPSNSQLKDHYTSALKLALKLLDYENLINCLLLNCCSSFNYSFEDEGHRRNEG